MYAARNHGDLTMFRDPIVEEIKRYREQYAARFNYDLRAIGEDIQRRQRDGGREVVRREPRRVRKSDVPKMSPS
jgi:hypothetical protein